MTVSKGSKDQKEFIIFYIIKDLVDHQIRIYNLIRKNEDLKLVKYKKLEDFYFHEQKYFNSFNIDKIDLPNLSQLNLILQQLHLEHNSLSSAISLLKEIKYQKETIFDFELCKNHSTLEKIILFIFGCKDLTFNYQYCIKDVGVKQSEFIEAILSSPLLSLYFKDNCLNHFHLFNISTRNRVFINDKTFYLLKDDDYLNLLKKSRINLDNIDDSKQIMVLRKYFYLRKYMKMDFKFEINKCFEVIINLNFNVNSLTYFLSKLINSQESYISNFERVNHLINKITFDNNLKRELSINLIKNSKLKYYLLNYKNAMMVSDKSIFFNNIKKNEISNFNEEELLAYRHLEKINKWYPLKKGPQITKADLLNKDNKNLLQQLFINRISIFTEKNVKGFNSDNLIKYKFNLINQSMYDEYLLISALYNNNMDEEPLFFDYFLFLKFLLNKSLNSFFLVDMKENINSLRYFSRCDYRLILSKGVTEFDLRGSKNESGSDLTLIFINSVLKLRDVINNTSFVLNMISYKKLEFSFKKIKWDYLAKPKYDVYISDSEYLRYITHIISRNSFVNVEIIDKLIQNFGELFNFNDLTNISTEKINELLLSGNYNEKHVNQLVFHQNNKSLNLINDF